MIHWLLSRTNILIPLINWEEFIQWIQQQKDEDEDFPIPLGDKDLRQQLTFYDSDGSVWLDVFMP